MDTSKPFHETHLAWIKAEQSALDAYKNYQELKEDADKIKKKWQDVYTKMSEDERKQYATL